MWVRLVRLFPKSLRIEFNNDLWNVHIFPSGAGCPHRTQTPTPPVGWPPPLPEFIARLPF